MSDWSEIVNIGIHESDHREVEAQDVRETIKARVEFSVQNH